MFTFETVLEIVGINPFVFIPSEILNQLFQEAGKNKGYIPVCGEVNGQAYTQTVLKYKGAWRLYINKKMLNNSPKRIGERIRVTIRFDSQIRLLAVHPALKKALAENKQAKRVFDDLTPSMRKEIVRYLSFLKNDESVKRNVEKAIGFLMGKNAFIGRENPK